MKQAKIVYLDNLNGVLKETIMPFVAEHSPGILGIYESDDANAEVNELINMRSPLFVSVKWDNFK